LSSPKGNNHSNFIKPQHFPYEHSVLSFLAYNVNYAIETIKKNKGVGRLLFKPKLRSKTGIITEFVHDNHKKQQIILHFVVNLLCLI
jgi:hypothetical protein